MYRTQVAMDSMESAKRIKKEMWMKRSSFLGLEEYTNGNSGYEHGKYPSPYPWEKSKKISLYLYY